MWQQKFKTSGAYLVAICWMFLLLIPSDAFSWFHYIDQMHVYATEPVGWILITAICGDLSTTLAGFESRCCGPAVLLLTSEQDGVTLQLRDSLSFSSLSPVLTKAQQPANCSYAHRWSPLSRSIFIYHYPSPKAEENIINVGLLWHDKARSPSVPHRKVRSSPAICCS